ncbi:MAG: LysM peptidoglycan-binding domain-containing protein [Planctomycetes bacterium]|nr:LysM peptidoglycan-binding domain-containing protein [Planctomycetota bacterium]
MIRVASRFVSVAVVVLGGSVALLTTGCGSTKAAKAQNPAPPSLSAPVRVENSVAQSNAAPYGEYAFLQDRQTGASAPLPRIEPPPAPEAIAPAPASEGTAAAGSYYTMQKGDTLYAVARKHNVPPKKLIAVNNFADPNKVSVGTKVLIPQ